MKQPVVRRLVGIVLAVSLFQLATLGPLTACERHASQSTSAPEHVGHDMATMHHDPVPAQPSNETSGPPPRCCMVAGTCASAAFSTIVLVPEETVMAGDGVDSIRLNPPASASLAPEPPPPKA